MRVILCKVNVRCLESPEQQLQSPTTLWAPIVALLLNIGVTIPVHQRITDAPLHIGERRSRNVQHLQHNGRASTPELGLAFIAICQWAESTELTILDSDYNRDVLCH
jgi:hypothetical protein